MTKKISNKNVIIINYVNNTVLLCLFIYLCDIIVNSHALGKWTEEEERRLAEVVHELTGTEAGDVVTQGVSWASVAELVGSRSEKQCRSKWLNYLNWKQSGGTEWSKEEDINLVRR